ncbi:unnamed protein product [Prorocentrum cordatum]|uniref:Cellulase n=1 Tax=Prorocentrum cordatum TaxID=2364126 RepID=A0ABN9Q719_9DINO|nr:unnamed protein product [Polarella glacialis]
MFRLPPIRLTPRAAPMPRHPPCVRQTGSLVHLPSAALRLARSATRKMAIGVRATNLATQTPCGRWTAGSRRTRQSGTARKSVSRARLTGRLAHFPSCCSEPGSKCYKKNDYWFACNQTCNPYYMWKDGGWVKTNETVWDCEEIRPPCTPNGESCALSKCCSEPGMKCYKKNDYWSSCNQTCNPNYLWMETGWVKTDDTHWDCEVITIDSTDVSTDSDAGNAADAVASTDSECSPNGCCSEPGAKCYKKNDYWSSCNQTCNPNYLWMETGWVVTNETVWDCEDLTVSPVESADPIADAEAEDQNNTCSQNGASCALSQCCAEPGSKCYKKNDYWSSCNQTCNPYYMWQVDRWVETNETVWDCEEVRPPCTPNGESCALSKCCSEPGMKCYKKNDHWSSCNQTCNPNYLWMETGWVKTNETVWDCEVITIDSTDVSTASDTTDSASSSDASTSSVCSPNGESCALTKCCAEAGSKCYKKNGNWSSCNQSCDPNSMWQVDRWVTTDEAVWDCEEVSLPCSPNGASCALSQCCSDPDSKCYKKNDHWIACNQTCDPNSMWTEGGWVVTSEAVWDCGEHIIDGSEASQNLWDWLLHLFGR